MKSLLSLIVIAGICVCAILFLILVDELRDMTWDYDATAALSLLFLCIPVTGLVYKFYKKLKWQNDFLYLFFWTRVKRSSRALKQTKQSLLNELKEEDRE